MFCQEIRLPPKEWIDHRLASLRETLNKDTVSSALALKELLGEIRLEAVMEKELTPDDIIEGKMGQSQSTSDSHNGTVPIFHDGMDSRSPLSRGQVSRE
jgi:hypothetical protein